MNNPFEPTALFWSSWRIFLRSNLFTFRKLPFTRFGGYKITTKAGRSMITLTTEAQPADRDSIDLVATFDSKGVLRATDGVMAHERS